MTSQSRFSNFGPNSGYIEELYKLYLVDPGLVGDTWASYFDAFSNGGSTAPVNGTAHSLGKASASSSQGAGNLELQAKASELLQAYRIRGHSKAAINPIHSTHFRDESPELDPAYYGIQSTDLGQQVLTSDFRGGGAIGLSDLIGQLEYIYCGPIGFEIDHIQDAEARKWLQQRVEARGPGAAAAFTNAERIRQLQKVIDAELFESELHKKYVGHKRFSLQGGESTIAMMSTIIERCAGAGIKEAVVGMAHRGRLNVLVNTLGKSFEEVFSEFEDQNIFTVLGSGDVKYHMGYESRYQSESGQDVRLTLAPNPSHLEFVNCVVEGISRAKQDLTHQGERSSVLPLLLHGDSAFIGQGVVAETLNMSRVEAYKTGGTIHIVINNQVGFTTNPADYRSSEYCTGFAKAVDAPVFHVNGDDVEAACWAAALALEYRNTFGTDVVLDLYCYRKYGHNEGDDPSFTQPVLYAEIKDKELVSEVYGKKLIAQGDISQADIEAYQEEFKRRFDDAVHRKESATPMGEACAMHGRLRVPTFETGVDLDRLRSVASALVDYPEGFTVHPKLDRILKKRVESLEEDSGIDWGFAEGLAFGSLVQDGCNVRLSGQDCERGTFSQRHLKLRDYEGRGSFEPISYHLSTGDGAGRFEVYNSTLSEAAVLGFEFGYSSVAPNSLVLWEAQFGDFANGAQVLIDQFISSSEQKWHQMSGVTLLLPHGYEGQGPEHSSARLERFLQLSADGNWVVTVPSNAAQYFHLLRLQGLTTIRRPLIVMTPKSLLRSADAACSVDELTAGQFHAVLEDSYVKDEQVEHVVFLSGKVYYDVKRTLDSLETSPRVKIIRVEQLYPFPQFDLRKVLGDIDAKSYSWIQEEPMNMGAWQYIEPYLRMKLRRDIDYIGRPVSASTATGSGKWHAIEQKSIMDALCAVVS